MFNKGLSYSAINIARSAISFFAPSSNGVKLGANPIIVRFMVGVRNSRPRLSRYVATWDVDLVLGLLMEFWPLKVLPLPLLVRKLVTLFLLVTSYRIQTLRALKVSNMLWVKEDLCVFVLDQKLKHTRDKNLGYISLTGYSPNPRLCIIKCLKEYVRRTRDLRGELDFLVLTTVKPYRQASHDTIGNWVTKTLSESGIDTTSFKPHSTRSASTSKYLSLKIPVEQILKKADWAAESTFRVYYDKQILPKGDISQVMLNNFLKNNK